MKLQLHQISVLISFALVILFSSSILGQKSSSPQTGPQNAGSYSMSQIESIGLAGSGDLSLSIPLASLPKGRGTAPGFSLNLVYNSKIWRTEQKWESDGRAIDGSEEDIPYTRNLLMPSADGGWSIPTKYSVRIDNRIEEGNIEKCTAGNSENYSKNSYQWKVSVATPDGSSIPFRPVGFEDIHKDGYFQIHPSGKSWKSSFYFDIENSPRCDFNVPQPQLKTGVHYYSTDGSGIRLFFPFESPDNWVLRYPNGLIVRNQPAADVKQLILDSNGNSVRITHEEYRGKMGTKITDDLNRFLFYDGDNVYHFGFNGAELITSLNWDTVTVYRNYKTTTNTEVHIPNNKLYTDLYQQVRVLKSLELPEQAGANLKFLFSYHASESTGQFPTSYTDGWGELKTVTLPAGLTAQYDFELPSSVLLESSSDVIKNKVTKKELSYTTRYDGVDEEKNEVWKYDIGFANTTVTGPDGKVSRQSHYGYSPFSDDVVTDWRSGLVHSEQRPDGTSVKKTWKHKNGNTPLQVTVVDPYVSSEVTTTRNHLGQLIKSKREFEYDQNQNLTELREYGFTNLESNSFPLLRVTRNTYYNPADSAESLYISDNDFRNPGSPNLLRLLKSTETLNAEGLVVSRREFLYDGSELPTNGNLTKVLSWLSTKGSLPDSPNPNGFKLNQSNSVSTETEFDQYGNIISVTDELGRTSVTQYDLIEGHSSLYPTKMTVAEGSRESSTLEFEYDFQTGLETRSKDVENDVVSTRGYDEIGRLVNSVDASGTSSESKVTHTYDMIRNLKITRSDLEAAGDQKIVEVVHYDPLGRVRLSRRLEDSATESPYEESEGVKVVKRFGYDNPTNPEISAGSYVLISNPFRSSTSHDAGSEPTMGWTLEENKSDGKTIKTTRYLGAALPPPLGNNSNHSGSQTSVLTGNSVLKTDAAGKEKRILSDALGRVTRVDEPSPGALKVSATSSQSTDYRHNAQDALIEVTQGEQSRHFLFDSLGRMLRVKQPEQEINPEITLDHGESNNTLWTAAFKYDEMGNILESTDANNNVISNFYDDRNRIIRRTFSEDSTPDVYFKYDDPEVQYSHGMLTSVNNGISTTSILEYDAVGRVKKSRQSTSGKNFDSHFRYSTSGQLVEQKYPSGRVVKNELMSDGKIARVSSKQTVDSTSRVYANGLSYSPENRIQRIKLGNGLWESAGFDGNLQTQDISLGTSAQRGNIWKIEMNYGALQENGTVDKTQNTGLLGSQTIHAGNTGATILQSFEYDGTNRLTKAKETSVGTETWAQTFAYDRFGNRTSQSSHEFGIDVTDGALDQPGFNPHSNRIAEGQGYEYDRNGNLIRDITPNGVRRIKFDGNNRQTEIRDEAGNILAKYYFDGVGKRIKKTSFGGNGEVNQTTLYVYSGTTLVAEYSDQSPPSTPKTHYVATDSLGSIRVITDQQGTVVSRRDFKPFGEQIASDSAVRTAASGYVLDNVKQRFTGLERDAETGFDFANARMYNSRHGRFTAVDPLLSSGKSVDPQTFNRYAYVMNSPLRFTDPSGLQANTVVSIPARVTKEAKETTAIVTNGTRRGTATLPPKMIALKVKLHKIAYRRQATASNINRANARNGGAMNPSEGASSAGAANVSSSSESNSRSTSAEVSTNPSATVKTEQTSAQSTSRSDSANVSQSGPLTDSTAIRKSIDTDTNRLITNYLNETETEDRNIILEVEWDDTGKKENVAITREKVHTYLTDFVARVKGMATCDTSPNLCARQNSNQNGVEPE